MVHWLLPGNYETMEHCLGITQICTTSLLLGGQNIVTDDIYDLVDKKIYNDVNDTVFRNVVRTPVAMSFTMSMQVYITMSMRISMTMSFTMLSDVNDNVY